MYDINKREEMLRDGFWPVREDGHECMATALGNLLYRPELLERYGLSDGRLEGEVPHCIVVYSPDKKF